MRRLQLLLQLLLGLLWRRGAALVRPAQWLRRTIMSQCLLSLLLLLSQRQHLRAPSDVPPYRG
jgi:hypothetical protein